MRVFACTGDAFFFSNSVASPRHGGPWGNFEILLEVFIPNTPRNHCITYTNSHVHQTILNNVTIIVSNNNFNQLCFLKSLLIKKYKSSLNYGIKDAKELLMYYFNSIVALTFLLYLTLIGHSCCTNIFIAISLFIFLIIVSLLVFLINFFALSHLWYVLYVFFHFYRNQFIFYY